MRYFGATPFLELVPPSIAADRTIINAARALNGFIGESAKAIPNILLFARLAHDSGFINPVPMLPSMTRLTDLAGGLAELEPYLLDLLAWQLHVESYDAGVSLQAKREMIQSSLLLHRRNGTPWAVRHALETLLRVPATLKEWFNYGGEPYFFRVRLDVTGHYVGLRWLAGAFQIVMDYKNVRSWLELLETFSTTRLNIRTGIGLSTNTSAYVDMYAPITPVSIYRGVALQSHTRAFLKIYAPMPDLKIYRGAALRVTTLCELVLYRSGKYPIHEQKAAFGISSRTCIVIQTYLKRMDPNHLYIKISDKITPLSNWQISPPKTDGGYLAIIQKGGSNG